jgi:hypothetical protein
MACLNFFTLRQCAVVFLFSLMVSAVGGLHAPVLRSEEPVKRFLERLQEEGLYDVGLKYLDVLASKGKLPMGMKEDLPLERNILLQESLRSVKTTQQRDDRMIAIEKGYKDFLGASPNNPRRSEAQTKLGDLLLERSQIALNESKKEENKSNAETFRLKARTGYLEALELYTKIIDELRPILESMKGDKIKPNDTEGKERRDRYQAEYRQAQILQSKMMEFVSQTYDSQSPERTQWLTKAETGLSQIIEKTSSAEAARRMLCYLYRGEIQRQLGKNAEARDSFANVADNEGTGIYRNWKAQATAGIIRLEATDKAKKHEASILRGDELLKQATPSDKNEPEWIDLQLAIAEARVNWNSLLDEKKEENKIRSNRKTARELFQSILKKQASADLQIQQSVRKAKEGLSGLGIEVAEKVDDKLPETKSFNDAIKAARERLDRAESAESTLPVLAQQIAKASPEKAAIEEQVKNLKADILKDRVQAIELYHRGLRLYRDKDPRDDLLETRYLLSYLYLRTEKHWECAAIAQDLLVSAKGTERAEKSGGFAMHSLNKLLIETAPENQMAFSRPLENLAKKLLASAPESVQAQDALDLLVKLALLNKSYDQAEKYVAMGNGKGGSGSSILGQILWGEYRRSLNQHRADKSEPTAQEAALKQRAESLLRSSWDNLTPERAEKNLVSGANTLATIYLSNDRLDEALSIINDPMKGTLKLIESKADLDAAVKLETLRTKLQAMVQAAGQGKGELVAADVASIVATMKQLSGANDALLTNALRNLASELQSRLEATKDLEQQAKLGSATGVLIKQLITASDDVGTIDSAGTAIFILASNMLKDPALAANAKPLMAIAEEAFSKVAAKPKDEANDTKFQLKLGLAKSGAGKFEEAHAIFKELLASSPSVLNIQVEAARNLQKWSGGNNVDLLRKAVFGCEPNAKKMNQVWGWVKISSQTSANKYKETYFESRLNLAKCLRMIGLCEQPDQRKKNLENAVSGIRQTFLISPDLGGSDSEAAFVKLLRELQQDLGRQAIGLEEFKQTKQQSQEK